MGSLIALALKLGIAPRFAKAAVIAALVALAIAALSLGKCAYDRSVIQKYEQKAEVKQVRREREADTNLQIQKERDQAAAQQRREEIDNATKDIPDRVPSARQRARVCLELQRQAAKRGAPKPAC